MTGVDLKGVWHTGSGNQISISEIISEIEKYIADGGKIFIGTDSQLKSDECVFVTAICMHGNFTKKYASYFFKKTREKNSSDKILRERIMKEVKRSLDISMFLLEKHPDADIEVHVDIGRTQRSATRTLVDSITGWLSGTGVGCKIKPNSWASSAVADQHTK
jgi:uncharacterized protein